MSLTSQRMLLLGDGRLVQAVGIGNVELVLPLGPVRVARIMMYNVLYIPKLTCNQFSVRVATAKGNIVQFGKNCCWIKHKGQLKARGTLLGKLYYLDCKSTRSTESAQSTQQVQADLWHQLFRHLNEWQLKELAQKNLTTGGKLPKQMNFLCCKSCTQGKLSKQLIKPIGQIHSKEKLELVHSDMCGPFQMQSIAGSKYLVTFIDNYSCCVHVAFMHHKSEVLEKFNVFEALVTNDSGKKIKVLRTDNGRDYVSNEFKKYLENKEIHHEVTVPYSPQQNGVAEWMNRTLVESA